MSAIRHRRRPLLAPGIDESDEDARDHISDDEFNGPNRMDAVGVVPGPREPPGNLQEAGLPLYKLKIIFGVLSLVFFLLGWVVKDALVTMSSLEDRRIHSQWQERMKAEHVQWDSEHQSLQLEKKRNKEETVKQEQTLQWTPPQPDPQCLRYGTRKWTAKLENGPAGHNPITACYGTHALIHGRRELPNFCDSDASGTSGTWHITFNETACLTYWAWIENMGCLSDSSGKRKFEGRLGGFRLGDNWLSMCASTPAEVSGVKLDGPHWCEDWTLLGHGYKGIWFIEDRRCSM